MADDEARDPQSSPKEPPKATEEPSEDKHATDASPTVDETSPNAAVNREDLISQARTFLQSPSVLPQDVESKRRFLVEKGLTPTEIEALLHQTPLLIPPRTYPQPPPSRLPILLLGIARLFAWVMGGSAVLLAIYRRYLFPRITQTTLARRSLRTHHLSLMRNFTTSVSRLKESHSESLSVLPHVEHIPESKEMSMCKSMDNLSKHMQSTGQDYSQIEPVTILRCAIHDCKHPTTEELFQHLEGKVPWLLSDAGLRFEHDLWNVLSTNSLFESVLSEGELSERWSYKLPEPTALSEVLIKLLTLSRTMNENKPSKLNAFRYLLETLTEVTGYASAHVYVPYRPAIAGMMSSSSHGPAEDELKREIRALKGLVLNRRSFMPAIPRASSFPSLRK